MSRKSVHLLQGIFTGLNHSNNQSQTVFSGDCFNINRSPSHNLENC